MSAERIVPTPESSDLPTFRLFSGGEEVSSENHLLAITVTYAVNKIPTARVTFLDGNVADEDYKISNSDLFIPGKEIEILAGYHSNENTIFKGIITAHGIKSRAKKSSVLEIECKDKAVKMTIGRRSAYYQDMSDSDIMEDLIGRYGLKSDVEATDLTHQEMVQYYSTDWDFLMERADANGKLVFVDDGTVMVKTPDTKQEPTLSLVYGSTMMEFEANIDSRNQFKNSKSASWDYSSQALFEEEGSSPGLKEQGNITADSLAEVASPEDYLLTHSGHVIDQELRSWASAQLLKSRLAKIIGRARCQGFGDLKPGQMIELSGVGDRFSGSAFCSTVRHNFTTGNWETDIQFGLSPEWFAKNEEIIDVPAAGLVPSVHGLQVGVVTQIEGDPDGEDRVRVRMPTINPDDEGIWARISSLDAGEERGAFFMPEIGDEVILGFINDDPRDPIILGMLHSSAKPAPLQLSDDNHEKGFVTRSEMKVLFNDDKKSITIETPNGNLLTLSDDAGGITVEDENGNKLEMSSGGITIESAADINIKASGDLKFEGTNTNLKAGAQFKAEGSAGAEMSTSAVAVVKGSLVQIN